MDAVIAVGGVAISAIANTVGDDVTGAVTAARAVVGATAGVAATTAKIEVTTASKI